VVESAINPALPGGASPVGSSVGVIVVHGVGDPMPSDALGSLVQGLIGTTTFRVTSPLTIEQRVEPNDAATGSPLVNCFPVAAATLESLREQDGRMQKVHMHAREVYWGDRSRVKGSVLGLLYALFDFVFGLKHVVVAAHRESTAHPRGAVIDALLRAGNTLSLAVLWLVRGPLFALNLLALSVGVVTQYAPLLKVGWLNERYAALLGCLILLLVPMFFYKQLASQRWSLSTVRTVLAISVAGALVAAFFWPGQTNGGWAVKSITTAISFAAFLTALAGIATLVCHLSAWIGQAISDRARLTTLTRALMVVNFCTALSVGLFSFFAMLGWTVVMNSVGKAADFIEKSLHLFPLLWLSVIAILVGFLLVMAANGWRGRNGPPGRFRFIVSPLVLVSYCVLLHVYGVLVIWMVIHLEAQHLGWLPEDVLRLAKGVHCRIKQFDETWMRVVLAVSAGLAALLAAFRAHALTALDLVLDVIAHFKADARGVRNAGVGQRRRGAADAGEERWVWESIVDRFQDVVATLVREHAVQHLVVLSHSQGTTVSLAGLGILRVTGTKVRTAPDNLKDIAVDVVTMGCPVSHLYRHYMNNQYKINAAPSEPRFRWLNVFREDDFIGTRVEGPHGDWPKNESVGARGHTHYWRDREVLHAVLGWLKLT
jgi:hypothetical protein